MGNSAGRDWNFQSRLKCSSEIVIFKRDWIFSIFGLLRSVLLHDPLGVHPNFGTCTFHSPWGAHFGLRLCFVHPHLSIPLSQKKFLSIAGAARISQQFTYGVVGEGAVAERLLLSTEASSLGPSCCVCKGERSELLSYCRSLSGIQLQRSSRCHPGSAGPHMLPTFPKGPKIEQIQDLEIFKREWKFQASRPLDPYFLWGILQVEIEIFNRDWNFQARLKISSEIEIFQSLGP